MVAETPFNGAADFAAGKMSGQLHSTPGQAFQRKVFR
jgi:hypothetical protein